MTGSEDRSGALEAIDRIVNRGADDVVEQALTVVRRLYPDAALGNDGRIEAGSVAGEDEAFLDRASLLISAHVRKGV